MQYDEMTAWLGEAADDLTDDQRDSLARAADDIDQRYPDPEDDPGAYAQEREAALIVAFRLLVEEPPTVLGELRDQLHRARSEEVAALAGLRQLATMLIRPGGRGIESQAGFAQCTNLNRMTIRDWLGLRD